MAVVRRFLFEVGTCGAVTLAILAIFLMEFTTVKVNLNICTVKLNLKFEFCRLKIEI